VHVYFYWEKRLLLNGGTTNDVTVGVCLCLVENSCHYSGK